MKITDIRATTVTVPLEAPLRHSNGAHWGRFVRNGTQQHAALEFACLDISGKNLGVPVYQLFGGRVRDEVGFASYLFYRYADPKSGQGEVRTVDQLVNHAKALKEEHGFTAHKLKAGVFDPDYELECYRALAAAFPDDTLRYDPNAALSVEQALRFGQAISGLRNDYFEDPTWGLAGMRRLREKLSTPLATNTVVIDFEQLGTNVRDPAVDVILLDTTFWGGIRACIRAAQTCDTFGLGIAVHSSGELGIQLSTMLHLGAVLPNLVFTADAHYHHLVDDVITGGKMRYKNGRIAVPDGPGLGVTLDREKLQTYAELYRSLGGYPYDRDQGRPKWYPLLPNTNFADPKDRRTPDLRTR